MNYAEFRQKLNMHLKQCTDKKASNIGSTELKNLINTSGVTRFVMKVDTVAKTMTVQIPICADLQKD